MTHSEFIEVAESIKKIEKGKCRDWLSKQMRLQLKKKGGRQGRLNLELIYSKTSLITDLEGKQDSCKNNIIEALNKIEPCKEILQSYIDENLPSCEMDFDVFLKKIKNDWKDSSQRPSPKTVGKLFNNAWASCGNDDRKTNMDEYNHIDIERIIEILAEKSKSMTFSDLVLKILEPEGNLDIKQLFKSYGIGTKHIPTDKEIYGVALGSYNPSENKIEINLDIIYDTSIWMGIDPLILFRKVLIHEMAHGYHHIGIDGDNKIWDKFGYQHFGKNTIEGLAQWYTYRYMYKLDLDANKDFPENLLTMLWVSVKQPSPYRHFVTWHRYNFENLNRVLIEARSNHYLQESSGKAFNKELRNNHRSKIV